jgi:NTE family protein
MPSIGLVLSAGGAPGRAYHAGTLAGIFHATGWDARDASLIVGTSAGSAAAAFLRAGLSPLDDHARYTSGEVSPAGREILDRVHVPGPVTAPLPEPRSGRLLRPSLALRALTGRVAPVTALSGLLPRGRWDGEPMGRRVRNAWGNAWPEDPTWVCAVRVRDGRRVVFGRDDVPTPDIGTASQASCAVPRVVRPVRVGRDEYIDGATHSATNADLLRGLGFDLVVIVSSMSAVPSVARSTPRTPAVMWYSRLLAREVRSLRASGTEVLVVQPTRVDLDVRRGEEPFADIAAHAVHTARANLARPEARRACELLAGAARAASAPSGPGR